MPTLNGQINSEITQYEYDKLYNLNTTLLQNIHYAESVQQGILPHKRHFERMFKDYFILYKPYGIISGDFYWIGQKGNIKYFVVGDCTGHGVSAAMLSVLALSFLNYLVLGKEFAQLGDLLSELDKKWIETFHQGSESPFNNDWLEIGICAINETEKTLTYAGAMSSLSIIQNNVQKTIKGNRFPIGGWQLEKKRNYTTQTVPYGSGAMIYLASDGFKDQFGGKLNKRFTTKNVSQMFQDYHHMECALQHLVFEDIFNRWKGTEEQTDDVCLLGIRLR